MAQRRRPVTARLSGALVGRPGRPRSSRWRTWPSRPRQRDRRNDRHRHPPHRRGAQRRPGASPPSTTGRRRPRAGTTVAFLTLLFLPFVALLPGAHRLRALAELPGGAPHRRAVRHLVHDFRRLRAVRRGVPERSSSGARSSRIVTCFGIVQVPVSAVRRAGHGMGCSSTPLLLKIVVLPHRRRSCPTRRPASSPRSQAGRTSTRRS